MGQRKPVSIRVACGQATLIRLPDGQRVMNVYGGDKGEGGLWSVDSRKMLTPYLAVKPKEKGIHTTLHVISNTGQEISFAQEITGVDTSLMPRSTRMRPEHTRTAASDVKWVPADEVLSCKMNADSLTLDFAA